MLCPFNASFIVVVVLYKKNVNKIFPFNTTFLQKKRNANNQLKTNSMDINFFIFISPFHPSVWYKSLTRKKLQDISVYYLSTFQDHHIYIYIKDITCQDSLLTYYWDNTLAFTLKFNDFMMIKKKWIQLLLHLFIYYRTLYCVRDIA